MWIFLYEFVVVSAAVAKASALFRKCKSWDYAYGLFCYNGLGESAVGF